MRIEYTSTAEMLNWELSALVHIGINFKQAIEDNHKVLVVFFLLENMGICFQLDCLHAICKLDQDFIRHALQVVNILKGFHQENFEIIIVGPVYAVFEV